REFDSGDIDFLRAIAAQVAGILERSELQRRTEVQLAEIRLSHDIHERFTKLSLDGAGIRLILEVIGSLAGGRAALYSGDGYRVRGAGEHSHGMPQRIHVPAIGASAQAERLGHRLPQRAWVVVLEPDDDKTEATLAPRGQQDRLDAALSGLIRSRLPGALTLVRSASAVFLVPDELAADLPAVEKLAAQVLSAARWIRRAAARNLGIHINSMTYRVERIESLTGLKLDDAETRVAISIALRARAMLGA